MRKDKRNSRTARRKCPQRINRFPRNATGFIWLRMKSTHGRNIEETVELQTEEIRRPSQSGFEQQDLAERRRNSRNGKNSWIFVNQIWSLKTPG
jgi:hypothetical protein